MSEITCTGCAAVKRDARPGQWWHLNNYYGFRGSFCPSCYEKISHDSSGQPRNPADHLWMTLKLRVDKGR